MFSLEFFSHVQVSAISVALVGPTSRSGVLKEPPCSNCVMARALASSTTTSRCRIRLLTLWLNAYQIPGIFYPAMFSARQRPHVKPHNMGLEVRAFLYRAEVPDDNYFSSRGD